MQDLPELVEKKYVHRGFFDLRIDTIKRKDLEPINYTILETKVAAVSVIAQDTEGRYVLVKEYRHPIRKYVYSLPGGRVEKEESFEISARREFLEETGYEAGKMKLLEKYYPMPSICDQKILLYHATECVLKKEADLDPFELIETIVISEKDLIKDLKAGAEIDGVLSAGLFYKNLHS